MSTPTIWCGLGVYGLVVAVYVTTAGRWLNRDRKE